MMQLFLDGGEFLHTRLNVYYSTSSRDKSWRPKIKKNLTCVLFFFTKSLKITSHTWSNAGYSFGTLVSHMTFLPRSNLCQGQFLVQGLDTPGRFFSGNFLNIFRKNQIIICTNYYPLIVTFFDFLSNFTNFQTKIRVKQY